MTFNLDKLRQIAKPRSEKEQKQAEERRRKRKENKSLHTVVKEDNS